MNGQLLRELSTEFGLGQRDLLRIISTAPKRYKVYQIPKRHGGTRTIAQPSKELKAIQRFVLDRLLSKLPVHERAMAYVEGRNIAQNASAHVGFRSVLKLDFENFFPSIKVADWRRYVQDHELPIDGQELTLYARILFWGMGNLRPVCLSIGAPTSPMMSNVIMFNLDDLFCKRADDLGVSYTRYADDITVAGESAENLLLFESFARSIIRRSKTPKLKFNEEKRGLYTMGQRRMVTGLVITPTHRISIGRQRKRLISAMLHRIKIGKADPEIKAELKGLLGFCIANEPEFVSRMRAKYGSAIVDSALRYVIPRRTEELNLI
jgi:hypothetical protein